MVVSFVPNSLKQLGFSRKPQSPPNNAATAQPSGMQSFLSSLENSSVSKAQQAYAQIQAPKTYKELQSFSVPRLGEGKLYELSNGHKIILVNKPGPTTITTTVYVGSGDDPAGKEEMTHLLEHLVASKSIYDTLNLSEKAHTKEETTSYSQQSIVKSPKDLEALIQQQANNVLKLEITPESLKREKTRVREEFNTHDHSKYEIFDNFTYKHLFNTDKDFYKIHNADQTVPTITQKDLENFYNTYYSPENMCTAIVGEIGEYPAIEMLNNAFNKPASKGIHKKHASDFPVNSFIQKPKRADLYMDTENTPLVSVSFVFPDPEGEEGKNCAILKNLLHDRLTQTDDKDLMKFNMYYGNIFKDKNSPMVIGFVAANLGGVLKAIC